MHPGEIYSSNLWGDMEVVEYKHSKHILIRFLESGNVYKVQRDNLIKGLVKDVERSKKITQEMYEADKLRKQEIRERSEALVTSLKEVEATEKKNHAEGVARWSRVLYDYTCNFSKSGILLSGKRIVDRAGLTYTIITKKSPRSSVWAITYEDSGNVYWVNEDAAKSGNWYDKLSEQGAKAEKLRRKLLNAAQYEADRERRIAMASAYQKNNVERTRVRNRNRRALRVGAEGTHTLEEVMNLLTQQNNKCACCKVELTEDTRELDHNMPLTLGGTNYIENLQWLCQFCNSVKSGSHPNDWEVYSNSDEFKKRRLDRLSNAVAS